MTEAQTAVDTFAPFVGTEGLPKVREIKAIGADGIRLILADSLRECDPDIAHGFLLSRLAEGLAKRMWEFCSVYPGTDECMVSDPDDNIKKYPDYPSAILAAARVEWPGRGDKPKCMEFTARLGGEEYRFCTDDPKLMSLIRGEDTADISSAFRVREP